MRAIGVRLWAALSFVVFVAASLPAARPAARGSRRWRSHRSTGRHAFQVEIAKDEATRERGLMDRRYMAADRGMLFEFDRDAPTAFWMKNTYIPLDMIFIRAFGRRDTHRRERRAAVRARHSVRRPLRGGARTERGRSRRRSG